VQKNDGQVTLQVRLLIDREAHLAFPDRLQNGQGEVEGGELERRVEAAGCP
jgi:hypothetical protein